MLEETGRKAQRTQVEDGQYYSTGLERTHTRLEEWDVYREKEKRMVKKPRASEEAHQHKSAAPLRSIEHPNLEL